MSNISYMSQLQKKAAENMTLDQIRAQNIERNQEMFRQLFASQLEVDHNPLNTINKDVTNEIASVDGPIKAFQELLERYPERRSQIVALKDALINCSMFPELNHRCVLVYGPSSSGKTFITQQVLSTLLHADQPHSSLNKQQQTISIYIDCRSLAHWQDLLHTLHIKTKRLLLLFKKRLTSHNRSQISVTLGTYGQWKCSSSHSSYSIQDLALFLHKSIGSLNLDPAEDPDLNLDPLLNKRRQSRKGKRKRAVQLVYHLDHLSHLSEGQEMVVGCLASLHGRLAELQTDSTEEEVEAVPVTMILGGVHPLFSSSSAGRSLLTVSFPAYSPDQVLAVCWRRYRIEQLQPLLLLIEGDIADYEQRYHREMSVLLPYLLSYTTTSSSTSVGGGGSGHLSVLYQLLLSLYLLSSTSTRESFLQTCYGHHLSRSHHDYREEGEEGGGQGEQKVGNSNDQQQQQGSNRGGGGGPIYLRRCIVELLASHVYQLDYGYTVIEEGMEVEKQGVEEGVTRKRRRLEEEQLQQPSRSLDRVRFLVDEERLTALLAELQLQSQPLPSSSSSTIAAAAPLPPPLPLAQPLLPHHPPVDLSSFPRDWLYLLLAAYLAGHTHRQADLVYVQHTVAVNNHFKKKKAGIAGGTGTEAMQQGGGGDVLYHRRSSQHSSQGGGFTIERVYALYARIARYVDHSSSGQGIAYGQPALMALLGHLEQCQLIARLPSGEEDGGCSYSCLVPWWLTKQVSDHLQFNLEAFLANASKLSLKIREKCR